VSWPSVVGGESDALVPVWSQMNIPSGANQPPPSSLAGVTTLHGVVHSAGMRTLGFSGPHELEDAGGAQAVVRILLNTPVTDDRKFTLLP
jgi:hypothetical protein